MTVAGCIADSGWKRQGVDIDDWGIWGKVDVAGTGVHDGSVSSLGSNDMGWW